MLKRNGFCFVKFDNRNNERDTNVKKTVALKKFYLHFCFKLSLQQRFQLTYENVQSSCMYVKLHLADSATK